MFRQIITAGAFASLAGSAFAAGPEPYVEPVVISPPVAADPFWAGGYLGGQLGYSYGDFDLGDTDLDNLDDDQVIGGLTAGYLWDVGRGFYVGPEFQYDFADLTVSDPDTGGTADFDEIARLKLIVGRELGNGLIYGSAGVAYASLDGVGDVFDGFDGSDTSYVVGIGYDYRVGDNATVGVEYMYHDFTGIGSNGADVSLNTLHLKASYRF